MDVICIVSIIYLTSEKENIITKICVCERARVCESVRECVYIYVCISGCVPFKFSHRTVNRPRIQKP